MITRRTRRAVTGAALLSVGVATFITGIALAANGADILPAQTLTVEPGSSVSARLTTASGADPGAVTITSAPPIGTATSKSGVLTFAAPDDIPAEYITPGIAGDPSGLLIDITVPDPATPTPSPSDPPTDSPSPAPTPAPTGSAGPSPEPSPTTTPPATPEPTGTPTPAPDAAASSPDIELASYNTGATSPAPSPTPAETSAPSPITFGYTVCRGADNQDCLDGSITVIIVPRALHAGNTQATVETAQQITLPSSALLTQQAGADWATYTASADRGHTEINPDHSISYTAPQTPGADNITYRLCPTGDPTSCVTGAVAVSVHHSFTAPSSTVSAITDRDGAFTIPIPALSGDNPAGTNSITITNSTPGTRVVIDQRTFRINASSPDYIGQIQLSYRACSEINAAHCATGTVTADVNTGFGFSTGAHTAQAGVSTSFQLRDFALDPARWRIDNSTATVVALDAPGVTINTSRLATEGTFTVSIDRNASHPITVHLCAAGAPSPVTFCRDITIQVTAPALILPERFFTGRTVSHTTTPTAAAPAPAQQSGGFDATWFIVAGAAIFMFFGAANLRTKGN